ncbi:MAG: hypothetical protein HUU21_26810 [Polyangiaceae bacterium]|nr:hypothetical protein [Polyangiaceae bacterium]
MMKLGSSAIVTIGALLSFSAGCLMEAADVGAEGLDEDVGVSPLTGGDGGNGIITGNGASALTPTLVSTHASLAAILTLDALTLSALEANELVTTLLGRTFLDYLVKCALPAGQSMTVSYLGSSYTFNGHVGMTPGWVNGALSTSDRRWLSACVLAHVNATTTNVSILLRGDHPALSSAVGSAGAAYTLREGAFYGDIFGLLQEKYACSGVGSTSARLCTESIAGLSPCGFVVPGNCRGTFQSACEALSGGIYDTCHSALLLPLLPSTPYPETITVYLQP